MPSRRDMIVEALRGSRRLGDRWRRRRSLAGATSRTVVETLEQRMLLSSVITSLVDSFIGSGVDTTKWAITNRGLENTGEAGYDAPIVDDYGLTLGGTTTKQYWYGSSLESLGVFSSQGDTTVSVNRASVAGSGTAWRSSLWIVQDSSSGQYLQFAQNVNETGWQYNQRIVGSGTAIASFNNVANDPGEHIMKLHYIPLGGTNANVEIYLDGNLGATVNFTNWDNSVPFKVVLTGQARAIGDSVSAVFKDLSAQGEAPTQPPAAPTLLAATSPEAGVNVALQWQDNASDEVNFHLERSADGVNFTDVATLPAIPGTGGTGTYVDAAPGAGATFTYRIRAFNAGSGGLYSAYSNTATATTPAAITSLADPLTGDAVDTTKWDITLRGLENTGEAGFDAPYEDYTGLTLGGYAGNQYWYGSSLESRGVFSSQGLTTITVDRYSLYGSGTAWRSSLWILQPTTGGQFLHFAENPNEGGWQYNQTGAGVGVAIPSFNSFASDGGEHVMKLVYIPLGGTNAQVQMYLDDQLGATATFTNWDNTVPFKVILTGQARATYDSVSAVFKDFSAQGAAPAAPPAAPTGLTATAAPSGLDVSLQWTDKADNEIIYAIERSADGVNFTQIGTAPLQEGTGGVLHYVDTAPAAGTTYSYRVRAFNAYNNGTYSDYSAVAHATTAGGITSLIDSLTGDAVDTTKWDITLRGLEKTGEAGYDAPYQDANGLMLGGTQSLQYWYGTSLETRSVFSSSVTTTITVDRVSLSGSGTAWRSSLWILQPSSGGQYLHFAENANETGWQFNQSNTGGGTSIAAFNDMASDGGEHIMKLVYTPLGGTYAKVDIYLDDLLGATVNYSNWDNSIAFKAILTGQARAAGDYVSAVFKDFNAQATPSATAAPAASTGMTATAASTGLNIDLKWTDNANNELSYQIERSTDGVNFKVIAVVPASDGTGSTMTYTDSVTAAGKKYYYRVRASNDFGSVNTYSAYSATASTTTAAPLPSLVDSFTGDAVDTTKWDITLRGLENTGEAGLNPPTVDDTGLTLGGTSTAQYWFGSSLESKGLFSSAAKTTISVDRVSIAGTGIYRSSLWILQPTPGGQFLHLSQNVNESSWSYNKTIGGAGTSVPEFNSHSNDEGEHIIKLVYIPLGGTNAKVELYVDGSLGDTINYTNWDNAIPFKVILSGMTRATGDSVSVVFKDFQAKAEPTFDGNLVGTAGNDSATIKVNAADPSKVDIWLTADTSGAPAFQVDKASLPAISVDGAGGNDVLHVDLTNGNPFTAGLTIVGGNVSLDLIGSSATNAFDATAKGSSVVTLTGSSILGGLSIADTASVVLKAGGDKFLKTGALTIGANAKLDLADNDLIVSNGNLAAISNWIKAARGNGSWSGNGLTSSAAKAMVAAKTAYTGLSVMLNNKAGTPILSSFDGQAVGANDVLVKYTYNGDVNLDGKVDAADYFLVDSGFITQQGQYRNGDLNLDGAVDAADYFLIDSAFIGQTSVLAAAPVKPVEAASVLASLFSVKPIL